MLYDKRWDAKVRTVGSLEHFIAWLETQVPTETYEWFDTERCACARYMASVGLRHPMTRWPKYRQQFEELAIHHTTYGSLLQAARAELAKQRTR